MQAREVVPVRFHIEPRSGVAPYLQLVSQMRQAMQLGLLSEGDRLPTVKEVAAQVAVNPNTVLKAYRELEHQGLVTPKPGVGTFVTRTLTDASLHEHEPLRRELLEWLTKAQRLGLNQDSIEARILSTLRLQNEGAI